MTNVIKVPNRMSITSTHNDAGEMEMTLTHQAKKMTFNEQEAYFVVHELSMMLSAAKLAHLSTLFVHFIHNLDKQENFYDELTELEGAFGLDNDLVDVLDSGNRRRRVNGFERHNINHLSASSINMYAECASAWCARYLFDKKFAFGVAPLIGILTEKLVQDVLLGDTFENALQRAEENFNRSNALNTNEKEMARITNIKDMATLALEELKPYGEPEFIHKLDGVEQQKIEINCNGGDWTIPVIGYLDFVFPKHGMIIDLKTSLRIPSTMSMSHKRQAAIYRAAKGNMGVKFLYCSPKKSSILEDENHTETLANVKSIAKRMEVFLRTHSKEEIQQTVPVNTGSFFWNKDQGLLKELYNL